MIDQLTDPVVRRLTRIRTQVRQIQWAGGVSRVALLALGSVLVEGLLDWYFHFDDPGFRFLLLLAILSTTAAALWRWLLVPVRTRLSNLDVALKIEQKYPNLRDSLASTVQFVEQEQSPEIGSPALQRVVVQQTARRLSSLDLDDFVRSGPMVRGLIGIAVMLLVASVVVLIQPQKAAVAVHRLLLPFGAPEWPRAVNWRLLDGNFEPLPSDPSVPLQVPRGEVFRFHAENSFGPMPQRVILETRSLNSTLPAATEALRTVSKDSGNGNFREFAPGQIVAPKTTIEFRIVGGDDYTMAWRRLNVVNPPVVEKLQVTVTPPEYAGKPIERLPEGIGHVAALIGSLVEVEAVASRPLVSASIRVRDRERIALPQADDRRLLRGSFRITEAGMGSWWFDLKDEEGIASSDLVRYEVRGIPDQEPDTQILLPVADLQVTPTATVPVEILSKDDLGLAAVRIVYRVNGGDETSVVLHDGATRPTEIRSEHTFQLEELSLEPGTQVRFQSEVEDDYLDPATNRRRVKRSVERVLTVVSPMAKKEEIEKEQATLLHDLEQATRQERQVLDQTRSLELQLEKAGNLRAEDVDALKRTEMLQRRVETQLNNPNLGLARKARETIEEMRRNQIDDAATERRLESIATELERLGQESMPKIENALTQARKLAEKPDATESAKEAEKELEKAREEEAGVVEALQDVQDALSEWRTERDLGRELQELTGAQQEIERETGEMQQRELTGANTEPGKENQKEADRARLAEKQRDVSERWREFEERLKDRLTNTADQQTTAAREALKDTLEESQTRDISGQMKETSSQIQENHLSEANRSQQDVLRKMKDLSDTLDQKRIQDEATLVKKIEQAKQDTESLSQRQQDLMDQLSQAATMPAGPEKEETLQKLQKEQQQIREEAARLARLLQRSGADRSSESVQRAGSKMSEAEESLEQNTPEEAQEKMQEVLDDIQQAEEELQEEKKEVEERLADELLEKSVDEIRAMIGRQQAAIDETQRLDGLHQVAGKWSRAQNASLKSLAELQKALQQETEGLASKLAPAKVISLSLRGASRAMQRAALLIEKKEVGGPTQQLQEQSKKKFEEIVEAILAKQKQNQSASSPPQGGGQQQEEGGTPSGPPGDSISAIAQLKILINLQREMIARTAELDALKNDPAHEWSAADTEELELIQQEQDQLADLAREMTELVAEKDTPDESTEEMEPDLPDVDSGPKKTQPPKEDEPGFLPKPSEQDQDDAKKPERTVEDLPDVD